MNWGKWGIWLILTLVLGVLGLVVLLYIPEMWMEGVLVYLPLTGLLSWLMVFRGRIGAKMGFFMLWVLIYVGWLVYLGPMIGRMFLPEVAP